MKRRIRQENLPYNDHSILGKTDKQTCFQCSDWDIHWNIHRYRRQGIDQPLRCLGGDDAHEGS